jgi:hypothetical protein
VALSVSPTPSSLSQGLSELDARTQFPSLPSLQDLSAVQVSDQSCGPDARAAPEATVSIASQCFADPITGVG